MSAEDPTEDYCEVVERLADEPVDMLEINISCPNVKEGGIAFGQDPKAVEADHQSSEETCKTAGDHEAEPECDGYHRDGKGRGGRWRRCAFSDQYADRNEDRYQPSDLCIWQIRPEACPARQYIRSQSVWYIRRHRQ